MVDKLAMSMPASSGNFLPPSVPSLRLSVAGVDAPISGEQLDEMHRAKVSAKPILRAAKVATFNAWTAGIIGGTAAVPSAIFLAFGVMQGDWTSLPATLVGSVLVWCAMREKQAGARLGLLDRRAVATLALNQAFITAAVCLYCIASAVIALRAPTLMSQLGSAGSAEMEAMVADIEGMTRSFIVPFYAIVAGLVALVQGLTAMYYRRRGPMIDRHRATTAPWILNMQERGVI